MNRTLTRKILSPFYVMLFSILVSELAYVSASNYTGDPVTLFWVLLTGFVSGTLSFSFTFILVRMLSKIEKQKTELAHLDKINKRLFTTISHDIKSPLANAHALMELISTKTISMDEAKLLMVDLNNSVKVLLKFLDDLISWSRYQIDKNPLQPEAFNSEEIVTQCIDLYRSIISKKKLTLKQGNLKSSILVDKGSYSFVIRNVLQNAVKYTPRGGVIEIYVEEKNDQVITVISDTGMGMDKVKIEKIKAKSNYISSKGTNEEAGTGFGLKASIEYLESQNGFLSIKSEKDVGTSVSICLPKS